MPLCSGRATTAWGRLQRSGRMDYGRQTRYGRNQYAAVCRTVRVRHTAQRHKVRAMRTCRSPAGGGDVTPAVWVPLSRGMTKPSGPLRAVRHSPRTFIAYKRGQCTQVRLAGFRAPKAVTLRLRTMTGAFVGRSLCKAPSYVSGPAHQLTASSRQLLQAQQVMLSLFAPHD